MVYLLPLLAYLLGSVSSAVLIARWFALEDPRTVGSGNPGATNMLRLGSRSAAALTLLGDVLKGALPVLIARLFTNEAAVLALVGGAAFIGHLFPLFFRFKGGKGVATGLGVYAALSPVLGVVLVATWLIVAGVLRYASVAALVTATVSPFYVWWLLSDNAYLLLSLVLAMLLIWRHRPNISNLIAGTEDKIELSRN